MCDLLQGLRRRTRDDGAQLRRPKDDETQFVCVRARWRPRCGSEAPGEGGVVDRLVSEPSRSCRWEIRAQIDLFGAGHTAPWQTAARAHNGGNARRAKLKADHAA